MSTNAELPIPNDARPSRSLLDGMAGQVADVARRAVGPERQVDALEVTRQAVSASHGTPWRSTFRALEFVAGGLVVAIFAGFLMVVTGTTSLGVLVMLGITIFEKVNDANTPAMEEHVDNLKLYGSWLAFYLVSYLIVTLTMMRGASSTPR